MAYGPECGGHALTPGNEVVPRSPTATKVAVAGLLAVSAMASAQTAPVLTTDDAVALALKGNREVQSAALEVERATEETAALKTTRLPQFQIYALGGQLLRQVSFTAPQSALGTLMQFWMPVGNGMAGRSDSEQTSFENASGRQS